MNRDPLPPLPHEPVRVTLADVIGAVSQSWPGIVLLWLAGGAVIFLTWNGSLFG